MGIFCVITHIAHGKPWVSGGFEKDGENRGFSGAMVAGLGTWRLVFVGENRELLFGQL